MNRFELRTVREGLGLTIQALSERLNVNPRTIERWEAGVSPIPDGIIRLIEGLEEAAANDVETLRKFSSGKENPKLILGDILAFPHTLREQRAIAFRVRQLNPEVEIVDKT